MVRSCSFAETYHLLKGEESVAIFPPAEEHVQAEIKYYIQKKSRLKSLLLFYQAMYRAQRKYIGEVPSIALERIFSGISENDEPILLKNGLQISLAVYQEFMQSLLEDACKYLLPELTTSQSKVLESLLTKTITDCVIAEKIRKPTNLSLPCLQSLLFERQNSLTEKELAVMAQIIRAACQIEYIRIAQQAQTLSLFKNWQQGRCPVCGEKPMLAILRQEDGARILECGLCHTQWPAPRLACVQCGNTNQDSLGFFFVPGQEFRRVYVCNDCKYYLKTIVLKETNRDLIPDLENVVTYFLDNVAQKEGYGYKKLQTEIN